MSVKNKGFFSFNLQNNKYFLYSLFSLLILSSCSSEKGDPDRFKQGVFEIPAGDGYSKTIITRIDSLQIEEYDKIISVSNDSLSEERRIKHVDTLYIKWKNNFFYSLKMKSPKKQLDKDAIYVQITKITDNSYQFSAKIGFSKFLTDGTIYKVK
ncbi:hypothetical protein SHK09_05100 [Polaribacter sp. PL03]|uniref:hypothetical protein n=1 Tax=Polaribacter sp. PL03 TaxID=3088353 RepID=UPI0029D179CD|nr:hypothetical protein [Polaribacter sp. PL03]MDX6746161.1 hypothetical protein [Polaribacter sp. PL03]